VTSTGTPLVLGQYMSNLPRLALLFATVLIFVPACASDDTSSKGQLVECTPSATGPTHCHGTDSTTPSMAGACVDVDEDGDGDDHDEADDADDDDDDGTSQMDDDDDDDGTMDDDDDDDDNDGINDDDDCDETDGGDDDDD
jgi:hypothetical protein